MLKVVHLQTLISYHGNAPLRLHQAMVNHGIDSKMIVYNTPRAATSNFFRYSGLIKQIKIYIYSLFQKNLSKHKNPGTYLFSYPKFIGNKVHKKKLLKDADVIYLHWIVGGFLNFENLESIFKLGKPVIFYMHDMWPITGGCHHSFDCQGYRTNCEYCPMFINKTKNSFASNEFLIKKSLYEKYNNLYFISPSKWLLESAKSSGLLVNKNIFHIPNIVDETIFKKVDKFTAKSILNFKQDAFIISFGCVAGKNNKYKGWQYLQEALNLIYKENKNYNFNIIIFGSDYDEITEQLIPFPVQFLGSINDEISMVILNNATDLFISPSLAESFGQTFLENIMCGTPVVGFDVGGVSEIIKHKYNGYLAEYQSSEDLAKGILYCYYNRLNFDRPKQYFSKLTVDKHVDVLNLLLNS
ncbi:glycosyltransferase involved in cell wall biosynthesis [Pedobacter sp. CG_S7]|uniref:glycosyltransferase n=1 Tax=Pedobacter sp. CG_S7 TaxID=3143930 RepID=UPI00339A6F8D